MKIEIKHRCNDFDSYRSARVKSLFNAENAYNWEKVVDLPIEGKDWKIGLVVGASGSGKTSIGNRIFSEPIHDLYAGWDNSKPIVDCIAPNGDFNTVTGALSAVGLGDVPAWLAWYVSALNVSLSTNLRLSLTGRSQKWGQPLSLKHGAKVPARLCFYPVTLIL